jgi:hypothetical protein
MIIEAKIITNSKKQSIVFCDSIYKIYLTSQPDKGKANKELISLLSEYFKLSKKNISIISGEKNKYKVINIIKE